MSHTNETVNLKLPQFVASDKATWLGDINQAFSRIDSFAGTSGAAVDGAVATANLAQTNAQAALEVANQANSGSGNAAEIANSAHTEAVNANTLAAQALQVANNTATLAGQLEENVEEVVASISGVYRASGASYTLLDLKATETTSGTVTLTDDCFVTFYNTVRRDSTATTIYSTHTLASIVLGDTDDSPKVRVSELGTRAVGYFQETHSMFLPKGTRIDAQVVPNDTAAYAALLIEALPTHRVLNN